MVGPAVRPTTAESAASQSSAICAGPSSKALLGALSTSTSATLRQNVGGYCPALEVTHSHRSFPVSSGSLTFPSRRTWAAQPRQRKPSLKSDGKVVSSRVGFKKLAPKRH